MSQSTFSIRMDEGIKREFDSLCAAFGMTASTAFNVFARAVIRERKIPFVITADNNESQSDTAFTLSDGYSAFTELRRQAAENGLQGLSQDEINAEIAAARREGGETVL